jgi:hypothetical protein
VVASLSASSSLGVELQTTAIDPVAGIDERLLLGGSLDMYVLWIRAPKPGEARRPCGSRLFAVRVGQDQVEKIIALFVKALNRLAFVEAVNAVAVGVGEPTRDAIGGNS